MRGLKIFAIILIVVGGVMVFFSDYIAQEVAAGKLKIERAQGQVDTAESVFSKTEATKPFGKVFTSGAQKKIDAGQAQVNQYEALSGNLKIVGFVLIGIGAVLLFFPRKK